MTVTPTTMYAATTDCSWWRLDKTKTLLCQLIFACLLPRSRGWYKRCFRCVEIRVADWAHLSSVEICRPPGRPQKRPVTSYHFSVLELSDLGQKPYMADMEICFKPGVCTRFTAAASPMRMLLLSRYFTLWLCFSAVQLWTVSNVSLWEF